ncbi:hypothetical protein [Natronorubrum sulfidifaciens]|uniref:Uncharacterized protein n=1 Tax=Natronorubrum sulfidifaciens JCM 14089 TaxID=1230460 RepID=L9W755_9EURY|nr:hypothetical protein [Natronorubrum sulfidifaciens]ELY45172.1 hypothetical protein C495_09525 [Natronorubrum sulfidifaciens JCM 14089]
MHMATSELRGSSLKLTRIESVSADATVRHVDQLESETLDTFYTALEGNRPITTAEIGLNAGDIIVGPEYYRVDLM